MSTTKRRESARAIKGPDGRWLCSCGCGRHPVKPRRHWFSEECVRAWKIKNDPGYVRSLVFDRDKGICAACGCDSEKAFRTWRQRRAEALRLIQWLEGRAGQSLTFQQKRETLWPDAFLSGRWNYLRHQRLIGAWLDRLTGPNPGWTAGRQTAWDADHIVPVIEGGGQCDLSNYRTLCHPCHKGATAALAARLAAKRKPVRGPQESQEELSLEQTA